MSYLYPIPKKEDWEYDLNKTRPIVIMEPSEKYTSTITPIQILNNTIEHVNQHKIPLYIFFRDMSKAFDNVDHQRLKIALKCIEQGDPLSPIIWKIFYDPILAHITNNYETDLLTIKTTSPEQINMPNNHHITSFKNNKGDLLNKQADKLAKEGHNIDPITYNYDSIKNFTEAKWNGYEIPVKTKLLLSGKFTTLMSHK
nr:10957_t:CDS:2 [Entrophospora candida]